MAASIAAAELTQDHSTLSMHLPPQPLPQQSIASEHMYKNKLQEYAQKSSLTLPLYETVYEGAPHAPRFRSTVSVGGTRYTSSAAFSQRKAAEQDAARVALASLSQKIKDEGHPIIHQKLKDEGYSLMHQKLKDEGYPLMHQDTTFCKSILNEYALKKRLQQPTYSTAQSGGLIPVFVSSVVFNGFTYTGDIGRNKKEAEQLAARSVILSLLDSINSEDIHEIIKSKLKLYAAINALKESDLDSFGLRGLNTPILHNPSVNAPGVNNPLVNTEGHANTNLNKRKQDEMPADAINLPSSGTNVTMQIAPITVQAAPASLHEYKKPKPTDDLMTLSSLVTFVPSRVPQQLSASTSGVKQSRRKKKKSKKGLLVKYQDSVMMMPIQQIPPYPVIQ